MRSFDQVMVDMIFLKCLKAFSPDQARDEHGRWEGGGASKPSGGGKMRGLSEKASSDYRNKLSQMSNDQLNSHIGSLQQKLSQFDVQGLHAGEYGHTSRDMLSAAQSELASR